MFDLGTHVLDHHVGLGGELHEGCVAFGRFQVELQKLFIAMQILKVKTIALAGHILAAGIGRLDANNIRAPVGQVAHAGGACTCQCQIEHGDAGEGEGD